MGLRHRFHRSGFVLVAIGVVIGSVTVLGAATPAGAVSSADCQVLVDGNASSSSQGSGQSPSDVEVLAEEADNLAAMADDVSDKKLKKALQRMANVYEEASNAKNTAGASAVMGKRAGTYAKGLKVYSKTLTKCMMTGLDSVPSR